MTLAFRRLQTGIGELLVAAHDRGICRIGFPAEMAGGWFPWFDRHYSLVPHAGDHPWLRTFERQLREYLARQRRGFTIPIDLKGTSFQLQVWERFLKIPYGSTVSYGEVARELGRPSASRAVGAAAASNPIPILVPCHRVTGSTGRLVGFGGGLELKEKLLSIEGSRIPFGV
ncbi:MAG: methylated-DNA--[protein]-cysteine S-methyltransferase [Acidobacteriota bacterium]|jgi:O-6-methylguanine DNA methyltransferase